MQKYFLQAKNVGDLTRIFLTAIEENYLVKKKNLPFREAYAISSKLVNYAEKKKVRLDQLSIKEINKFKSSVK